MRYNRANLESSCNAATDAARKSGKDHFVVATAYGYTVTTIENPFQSYVLCAPDGKRYSFHFDPSKVSFIGSSAVS